MKHRPDIVTFSMERFHDETWEEYDERLISQAWIKAGINHKKYAFRDAVLEKVIVFGMFLFIGFILAMIF